MMSEEPLLRTGEDFTDIYAAHIDTVYRIALMILKNPAEAEDATQAAFLQLMTAGKLFEDHEHVKAWLIVTVQNCCRNMLKSWWKRKRTDLEAIPEAAAPPASDSKEDEIYSAICALDEKYRLPVYLYYYEGYKTAEIAGLLDTHDATIRTRLRTARKKLRLFLEEDGYVLE